jgi:hypothetical protein
MSLILKKNADNLINDQQKLLQHICVLVIYGMAFTDNTQCHGTHITECEDELQHATTKRLYEELKLFIITSKIKHWLYIPRN